MELKDNKIILKDDSISIKKIINWFDISYTDIEHAYLRVEEVKAKMCCGVSHFDMIFLMLVMKDLKDPYKVPITKLDKGKEMLEIIREKNPEAKIGKYSSEAAAAAAASADGDMQVPT
ncbi:MAG: hypothetical protein Q4E57_01050 [Eubacteriales bacterium]|nr:hypothetical protein [Eubacteriales bacterium]